MERVVLLTWSRPVTAAAAAAPPGQSERGVAAWVTIAGGEVPDHISIIVCFILFFILIVIFIINLIITIRCYPSLSSSSSSAPSSVSMLLSSIISSRSRYLQHNSMFFAKLSSSWNNVFVCELKYLWSNITETLFQTELSFDRWSLYSWYTLKYCRNLTTCKILLSVTPRLYLPYN